MTNRLKLIDLFSGIGGLSIGFKKTGFTPLLGVEYDKEIALAYEKNVKAKCISEDIQKINPKDILSTLSLKAGELDVIVGGPPCQGFSMANRKRILDDPRNRLFVHFMKMVKELKPKAILIENVHGLKSHSVINEIFTEFHKFGYDLNYQVLDAVRFGVPQFRERLFFAGNIDGVKFKFPEGEYSAKEKSGQKMLFGAQKNIHNKEYITVCEAISDLPRLKRGESEEDYSMDPITQYQKERRGRMKNLHNHSATPHNEEAYKRIKLIKQGQNWVNLPKNLQTKSCHSGAYGRLSDDSPSPTITTRIDTPTTGRVIHPHDNRTITIREGARIQSFDDSVIFCGTRTSMGKQLGNAVPPLLAKAIAIEIKKQFFR